MQQKFKKFLKKNFDCHFERNEMKSRPEPAKAFTYVNKSPAIECFRIIQMAVISPFRSITLRFSRNDREKLRESDFKPGGIILWVFFDIFDDIFDGFVFV